MKSTADIIALWDQGELKSLGDLIRFVKADALRHAAELCRDCGRTEDYENAHAIEDEADKLEKR